jgi:hypothetical protein
VKIKTTLMILGSIAALPLFGGRASDSYTIEAEGLLPQTTLAGGGYALQGTLAGFSGSSSGNYTLLAGVNPASNTFISLPMIVQQPEAVDLIEGKFLQLNVTAQGPGPITFQWLKDGDPIPGATSNRYQKGTHVDDAGDYTVVVSNPFGNVSSLTASVSVLGKPVITKELADKSVDLGNGVLFTVTATSDAPLTYAWYLNDVLIAGKTLHILNVAHISLDDLGTYRVDVTNDAGTVSSSAEVSLRGLQSGEGPTALVGSTILEEATDYTSYQSDWFGEFKIYDGSQLGWVYTDSLGWVYFTSISTPEASYIYPLLVNGILYTNNMVYPTYAYSYSDSSWLLLPSTNDASTGSIWAWVYKTSSWKKYANDQ